MIQPTEFRVLIRRLISQKSYTIINLIGLTVGFTAVILIGLYVINQLSFDKNLADHERVFRPVQIQNEPGVGEQHVAVTMGPLAASVKAELAQVTDVIRVMPCWYFNLISTTSQGSDSVSVAKQFSARNYWYADSNAFSFFGFELLEGNPVTALRHPFSIVLTEKEAMRLFNSTRNLLGKTLLIDGGSYAITGLMKDMEGESHLKIDALASFSSIDNDQRFEYLKHWGNNSLGTYLKLTSPDQQAAVEEGMNEALRKRTLKEDGKEPDIRFYLQPLDDIYLDSGHIKFQITSRNGNSTTVYLFLIVGVLVLITACVNFINMSLARAVKRSREVGVRKVLGATSYDLFSQLLGEAILFSVISAGLAVMMVELLMPTFNSIMNLQLGLFDSPWLFPLLAGVIVLVSIISGGYPAFYLSRYEPVTVLKGVGSHRGKSASYLSRTLVAFQYAVTTGMVFMVIVAWTQYKFAVKKDLGINYNGIVALHHRAPNPQRFIPQMKARLLQHPGIESVSAAADINGAAGSQGPVSIDDTAKSRLMVRYCFIDEDFFPMMGIPVVEGRNFSREYSTDSSQSIILNQAAVDALGWKNPIGKRFKSFTEDSTLRPVVVGVIRDYNYYSIHWKIEPAIFLLRLEETGTLVVKLRNPEQDSSLNSAAMQHIETVWNEFFPTAPFDPEFANQRIKRWYANENRTMQLFLFFAILSVIVSCLGLYGLSSLMMEQRIREIGIRRVLGGSYESISRLLLAQYVKLVLAGGIVAAPIAWFLAGNLLNGFAYRAAVSPLMLIGALLLTIIIAMTTIWHRVYATSRTNPVDALKYE